MDWSYSASQMFSYYPKYEYLDNVLTLTGRKKIKLYIDFKSCCQALFQEWAVKQIINQSQGTRTVDTSLFFAALEFISFHKLYAKKRNIDIDFYFFMESGKSSYHKEIYSGYKADRGIGDFFGLDDATREFFFTILDKNYHVIDKVLNKIPKVSFIRLKFLEADFIPYYLMKHVLDKNDVDESCNIIYSTDKDLCQCLDSLNIFQFYRHYKKVQMLTEKDIFSHWLKKELVIENSAQWLPLALSIVGDSGDGIPGVGGIAGTTISKIFPSVMTLCGNSMDKVYQNIYDKKSIFDKSYIPANNSIMKVINSESEIIRNLKLISFKMLSDAVNGGYPTDMIDKKNQIIENVKGTYKAGGPQVLFEALVKTGLFDNVNEKTIVNLF